MLRTCNVKSALIYENSTKCKHHLSQSIIRTQSRNPTHSIQSSCAPSSPLQISLTNFTMHKNHFLALQPPSAPSYTINSSRSGTSRCTSSHPPSHSQPSWPLSHQQLVKIPPTTSSTTAQIQDVNSNLSPRHLERLEHV
jgi:hypothetical protein